MRVARLFLFADWPEKYLSGQSGGGISNASGTRLVRVSAQRLSRSCCKLSPMKIPLSRLAAPGSPRMGKHGPIGPQGPIGIKGDLGVQETLILWDLEACPV